MEWTTPATASFLVRGVPRIVAVKHSSQRSTVPSQDFYRRWSRSGQAGLSGSRGRCRGPRRRRSGAAAEGRFGIPPAHCLWCRLNELDDETGKVIRPFLLSQKPMRRRAVVSWAFPHRSNHRFCACRERPGYLRFSCPREFAAFWAYAAAKLVRRQGTAGARFQDGQSISAQAACGRCTCCSLQSQALHRCVEKLGGSPDAEPRPSSL